MSCYRAPRVGHDRGAGSSQVLRQPAAVDGVTFDVEQGEFFGILGPNGAGKTTTLEIVEGLRQADSGR